MREKVINWQIMSRRKKKESVLFCLVNFSLDFKILAKLLFLVVDRAYSLILLEEKTSRGWDWER